MTAVRWAVRPGAFYLLLQSLAFAQVTTADIVGRVTDSTGAVLPGATVTITNEGTRDVRTAPTTESGDYVRSPTRSARRGRCSSRRSCCSGPPSFGRMMAFRAEYLRGR